MTIDGNLLFWVSVGGVAIVIVVAMWLGRLD